MLMDLLSFCNIKPVLNQIEVHHYFVQTDLVDFYRKCGVAVEAYAPLSGPSFPARKGEYKELNLLKDPVIESLSNKYNKAPSTIILNMHLHHRNHIVIPNTYNTSHLEQNYRVWDFKFSSEDYEKISDLDISARLYNPKYYKEYERDYYPYFD